MTEEQQKSRIDSLIGLFRALLKFDPLVALIAILIIAPVAIPIIQAIISGDTVVVITFTVFIGVFTMLVYIPLMIVKTRQDTEKELAETRQKAVETEAKNRLLIAESKQKRLDELVTARIQTLTAERDFILGKSILEDRAIFKKAMEQLHEVLKNGDVNFVSQITFTETVQKVLEDLSVIYQKLDDIEGSPVAIKQEPLSYSPDHLKDVQGQLNDYKANYEGLERTLADLREKYDTITNVNMDQTGKIYEAQAHLAELRDLIDQYRKAFGELPEPDEIYIKGEKEWAKPSQDLTVDIKGGLPKTLPEPTKFDASKLKMSTNGSSNLPKPAEQLTEEEALKMHHAFETATEEKKDNLIISTVKKVIDKVTPSKSVLEEAVTALDNLTDETEDDEPRTFPPEPTTSSFREMQRGIEAPKFWTCPKCQRDNDMKKVRCPRCSTSRAAKAP